MKRWGDTFLPKAKEGDVQQGQSLVNTTADRMRELILAQEPDVLIGSLPELAKALGVGIATIQQAARVLEYEGLLDVRRGPGGGYFGRRPDAAALERSVATYLRLHRSAHYEALEMMTLLDCELMPAAASCVTDGLFGELYALGERIDHCVTSEERMSFEDDLHVILFSMVDKPLMELLARVSMRFYRNRWIPAIFEGEDGLRAWRRWRHQVIEAILARDPERSRFEAKRHRRELLDRVEKMRVSIECRPLEG